MKFVGTAILRLVLGTTSGVLIGLLLGFGAAQVVGSAFTFQSTQAREVAQDKVALIATVATVVFVVLLSLFGGHIRLSGRTRWTAMGALYGVIVAVVVSYAIASARGEWPRNSKRPQTAFIWGSTFAAPAFGFLGGAIALCCCPRNDGKEEKHGKQTAT